MSYSDAFEKLYAMTLDTKVITMTRYRRIAIYFGRMKMSELIEEKQGMDCNFDPATRSTALGYFANLTNIEWDIIKNDMMMSVDAMTDGEWKVKRTEWIYALDTFREFERD